MNEENKDENVGISSSRVSTNDSNEQDANGTLKLSKLINIDISEDFNEITSRSIGFDENDLESNNLRETDSSISNDHDDISPNVLGIVE
jgi:hypothetical protein